MSTSPAWLVLAMHLPSRPAYLRVKLWRRLREGGATSVAGVHLLPDAAEHRALLSAVRDEATRSGGQAIFLAVPTIDGCADPAALFRATRALDYERWIAHAERRMATDVKQAHVTTMRRNLDRIRAIDFFPDAAVERAEGVMGQLVRAAQRHPAVQRSTPAQLFRAKELHGRVWVTRRGLGIDRIASAWLIGRFIDPRPRFRFVDPDRYVHQPRELRFDMADGEFTHEGDLCSFETLIRRTDVMVNSALEEISRIIHQLDIEDDRYDCRDAPALAAALEQICAENPRDQDRLQAGAALLDSLHERLAAQS